MRNTIIILVVIIVLGVIFYAFIGNGSAPVVPDPTIAEPVNTEGQPITPGDREVRGTVESVNTDQVAADGPAFVTIKTESGVETVIAIRSMGMNLCPAEPHITNIYKLKAGDTVEARGTVEEKDTIVPCESPGHYLKVVTQ